MKKKAKKSIAFHSIDITNDERLTDYCLEAYESNIKNNLSETEALAQAILSTKEAIKQSCSIYKRKTPYGFSLSLSFAAFVISYLFFMVLSFDLAVYRIMYPIFFIMASATLAYTGITYKKRKKLDFIIVGALFLSVLIINIEALLFMYKVRTNEISYYLYYNFPGVLELTTSKLISSCPNKYQLIKSITLFDPILIISFICLICSTIFTIIERRKKL